MELTIEQHSLYKKLLVQLLDAFDSFCRENNLRYYASGGTAIGAIRHKGFIPWDDDIDVVMVREDYDRFLTLNHKLANTHYKIIDTSCKGYYLPYAKFVDESTTIWEVPEHEFIMGVFIDVFPLNHVDNDLISIKKFQKKYIKACNNYFSLNLHFSIKSVLSLRHPRRMFAWFKYVFSCLFLKNLYEKKFWECEEQLKTSSGDYLLNYYTPYKIEKELLKPEWFKEQVRVPFENTEINLMTGYEHYLTQMFGDYMTPPPLEKRLSHHFHYFVDLQRGLSLEEAKEVLNKDNK